MRFIIGLFLATILHAGMFDNFGGNLGASDGSCEDTTVENIDGADSDAYMQYEDKTEHCRNYKFKVQVDGYISVEYNATDDSNLSIGDNSVSGYKEDYLFIKVKKDTDYTAVFSKKELGDTTYDIRFDFIKTVKEEEADSVCSGESTSSGVSFHCVSFKDGIKIPIINSGDVNISDIRVIYKNDKVMIGNLKCEIYPGTDDNPDKNESCVFNTNQRAFFNFREHTIPPDQNYTYNGDNRNETYIYLEVTGGGNPLGCNDADLKIIYTAEGKTYKGALEECIEPEFCYDYAYEQNGRFFTEENNGTEEPYIKGSVSKTAPIDVKFYIANNPKADPKPNMSAKDMVLNIYEINATQADYEGNSTKVILPRTILEKSLVDGDDLNVSKGNENGSLTDIQIGTVKATDRFYAHYTLDDVNVTDINMSLDIKITYSTGLADHEKRVGANDIHLCPSRGYSYNPEPGLFTVVDTKNYKDGEYYNIPTQVASREGNFSVLSMDENVSSNKLKNRSVMVGVELIDVSSFHYTEATCQEESSSINKDDKIWVIFNDENITTFDKNALDKAIEDGRTTLDKSSNYYKSIKRNTAFRITYNTNQNDSVVTIEAKDGGWDITNLDNLNENNNSCGTSEVNATVKDECSDGSMNAEKLTGCMECLYGGVKLTDSNDTTGTRFVCSRDNFSLRPEAFKISFIEQNQTNGSNQQEVVTNEGNISSPVIQRLNIASGYKYRVEVNATNHIDSNATYGYTKEYMNSVVPLIWEPIDGIDVSGCNDVDDKNVTTTFIHGKIDQNISIPQVGDYLISFRDDKWTRPDSNKTHMKHHYNDDGTVKDHFKDELDCEENSSVVFATDEDGKNGCRISSDHNNTEADLSYRDINVTTHPYKFDMSAISSKIGISNSPLVDGAFIYMNDLSNADDENISLHLNGDINASGYNGEMMSNFVDKCYAKDINISFSSTTTNTDLTTKLQYRLKLFDKDGNVTLDTNATDFLSNGVVSLSQDHFIKELNGTIKTVFEVNFARDSGIAKNPVAITYASYKIDCNNTADCSYDKNKTVNGRLKIDKTLKYLYGKTHGTRQTIIGDNGIIKLDYEVYCNGDDCNKSLLPDGADAKYSDDPRWFINTHHKNSMGSVNTVKESRSPAKVTVNSQADHDDTVDINVTYSATRKNYPYRTTMENNASNWLIYNKYNSTKKVNDFSVDFLKSGSDWAGKDSAKSSSKNKGADRTNRRSQW